MDIMQFIIIGMVAVILATVVLAVLSYGAFKMRDRGKKAESQPATAGPLFFERVNFTSDSSRADMTQH